MTYRESADLQSALELIKKMVQMNVPIWDSMIAIILSLCGQSGETLKLQKKCLIGILQNMLKSKTPKRTMYNSLIACLTEANQFNEAFEIYEDMTDNKKIKPGIDTLTPLLNMELGLKIIF